MTETAARLTDATLEELEALADAAMPGPWLINDRNEHGDVYIGNAERHWLFISEIDRALNKEETEASATFVALSREAVPALIRELRVTRAALAATTDAITTIHDCVASGPQDGRDISIEGVCRYALKQARAALPQQ